MKQANPKLNCWVTDELEDWTGTEMWIKETFSPYSGSVNNLWVFNAAQSLN